MATFRNRSTASDLPEGLRQFVVRDWVDLDDSDPLFEFVRQISAKARPLSPFVAHVIGPRRYSDAVVRLVGPILGTDPARQLAAETVRNWAGVVANCKRGECPCCACPRPVWFPALCWQPLSSLSGNGELAPTGRGKVVSEYASHESLRPRARRLCCID
jgi:hypothetical protein